ncbi:MAG: phosphatidylglycerophosphatase A [Alphaproteobacteria bacterium]|nr:phosphatidylglycerophosphatase A [Alphaproteobacteria bacterium]MBU6471775.1 phosphatidylglycerophosphatase A [Alphaproteobacteria bacterium]MDE2011716.1 phosphatidylglycerophosphatase A [Alphaproteobacteria bacterium]MDE2074314.1 phosphatidylglycerophosphatase A [Alphaproteobacteria bacterium]MDE2353117.1 phosphatidylglycerophosphatase A [Alphaproteobacteria bacterium]
MKAYTWFATLCGIGLIPFAPGTLASLAALPFAWLLLVTGDIDGLGTGIALAIAIGLWACDMTVSETGNPDPQQCVIDELAGQWIACMAAPLTLTGFAVAFVAFRVFDIWKPWPISAAEKAKGGMGVMADDLVAGLFALIVVVAVRQAGLI